MVKSSVLTVKFFVNVFQITYPQKVLPPLLGASMDATARILSHDGLSGISLQAESVDPLNSMLNGTAIDQSTPGRLETLGQSSNGYLRSLMYSQTYKRSGPTITPRGRGRGGYNKRQNGHWSR